jgi:hypothetical protein
MSDKPARYIDDDGTIIYRASSLGTCDGVMLGIAAGRTPNQPPEWLQTIFDEGHTAEPMILGMLLGSGPDRAGLVLDTQTEWDLYIGEINDRPVIVRGHSDGWDPAADVIVECKKFRSSTWPKFLSAKIEVSDLYPWQTSAYMHAAGQAGYGPRLLFVGGHWQNDTVSEIAVFEYADPPIALSAIRKRIARWENMIAEGIDVTDLAGCSARFYPCPMWGKGCPAETEPVNDIELSGEWADLAATYIAELDALSASTRDHDAALKAAKTRKKELEAGLDALVEAMLDADVIDAPPKRLKVGGRTLTHVVSEIPEKVSKPYRLDYWKVQ